MFVVCFWLGRVLFASFSVHTCRSKGVGTKGQTLSLSRSFSCSILFGFVKCNSFVAIIIVVVVVVFCGLTLIVPPQSFHPCQEEYHRRGTQGYQSCHGWNRINHKKCGRCQQRYLGHVFKGKVREQSQDGCQDKVAVCVVLAVVGTAVLLASFWPKSRGRC